MEAKLRILAVDDNSINLATIEQELKGQYEVITVNSGFRAIQYLRSAKPDLILLDIQMALKDGIETLKEIRAMENGASIPVIMLTSKQDKESIIECSRLGAMDYVLKPFNTRNLQERIIRTLKRSGVIEVNSVEIYEKIKDVETALKEDNNIKRALSKLDDVLSYKMDDEVSGRLQNVRFRLKNEDTLTALRLLDRVTKMLERSIGEVPAEKEIISDGNVYKCFQQILKDLEEFNVKEASEKLEHLMEKKMSSGLREFCEELQTHLEEYDDGAAEEALRKKLAER